MEVLDTTIANVALRHIAGGLAVGIDESTYIITSYLVANAIVLSISGWLSTVIGRKRFYMICVAIFTFASLLCGFAWSLQALVLFRILQGSAAAAWHQRAGDPGGFVSARETRPGLRDLRHRGGGRAGGRADARRLDHRHLYVALDLFDQRADGPALAVSGRHAGQRAIRRRRGDAKLLRKGFASTISASSSLRSGSARSNSCSTRASATTGSARA